MANDYGYFGSGSTGYAHITNRLFTVTLGVPMAAVVGVDLRSGIMATTMVVIIPVVEFCC